MKHYVLGGVDNKTPIEEPDILNWARQLESTNRIVRKDTYKVKVEGIPVGNIEISTVFLGLDHAFHGGPPLLFETMVFGGQLDGHSDRCATWEAAEKMHEKAIEMVKNIRRP